MLCRDVVWEFDERGTHFESFSDQFLDDVGGENFSLKVEWGFVFEVLLAKGVEDVVFIGIFFVLDDGVVREGVIADHVGFFESGGFSSNVLEESVREFGVRATGLMGVADQGEFATGVEGHFNGCFFPYLHKSSDVISETSKIVFAS